MRKDRRDTIKSEADYRGRDYGRDEMTYRSREEFEPRETSKERSSFSSELDHRSRPFDNSPHARASNPYSRERDVTSREEISRGFERDVPRGRYEYDRDYYARDRDPFLLQTPKMLNSYGHEIVDERGERYKRRSRSPPFSDYRAGASGREEGARRSVFDSTPGFNTKMPHTQPSYKDNERPIVTSTHSFSNEGPIRRSSSPNMSFKASSAYSYHSGGGSQHISSDDRLIIPQLSTTNFSNSGITAPSPNGHSFPSASGNKFNSKPLPYPPNPMDPQLPKVVRPRLIDYSRLSESLKYAWNEREEKDFEKSLSDRRRMATEDEHHLAELRRVRFESAMADWEVAKWDNQVELISRQLEEQESELLLLRKKP
ncbi:hypothetical protein HDU67_003007 [Dinochytrium kinnereticum]|nr:hypothetical protein HDU67_003007 [Dinochytrium kinnereticum]